MTYFKGYRGGATLASGARSSCTITLFRDRYLGASDLSTRYAGVNFIGTGDRAFLNDSGGLAIAVDRSCPHGFIALIRFGDSGATLS